LGAYEIIKSRKDAFTTSGLIGWRAVTIANVNPAEAMERFDEAADAFGADAQPDNIEELMQRGGFWSGTNQQLWAKYFRARARVIESIRRPAEVSSLLEQARECLVGTEWGHHSSEVSKFNVLINVLSTLVSDPTSFSAEDARREYERELSRLEEKEEDRLAITFITDAADAFRGYQTSPALELTRNRLETALNALAKIPVIGPEVTEVVRPEIGKSAILTIEGGPIRTWMHRSLESIANEAVLRRVLLRLLQSALPKYAQIRHGPIEEGKDIAALTEEDGTFVLRLYAAKCGDITKPKWHAAREELEEMFTVDTNRFQLPVVPDRIEGSLVTNGHASPFAERAMEGWFNSRRTALEWAVEFIHLDKLVEWIVKNHLITELRAALEEHGIKIGEVPKERRSAAKTAKPKSKRKRAPRIKRTTKRGKKSQPPIKSTSGRRVQRTRAPRARRGARTPPRGR
jgi:hypothetical protein